MNSGTIWGRFVEKPRGKKSRATVPLSASGPDIEGYCHISPEMEFKLKGTVARDFRPLGFSTNRPHMVPEFTS